MSATCLEQFVLTLMPSTYWRAFTYLQTAEVHYLIQGGGGGVALYLGHLGVFFSGLGTRLLVNRSLRPRLMLIQHPKNCLD